MLFEVLDLGVRPPWLVTCTDVSDAAHSPLEVKIQSGAANELIRCMIDLLPCETSRKEA